MAPAVDFAGVVLGSSAQRSVLFENAGDEPLTLAGARLAPEDAEASSRDRPRWSTARPAPCASASLLHAGSSSLARSRYPHRSPEPSQLPLQGRGIVPAVLAVKRELNFGRVLTGASGTRTRTLAIDNEGAQPLPPPGFELTGNSPAQVAAFSFDSQCTAPSSLP